MKEPTVPTKGEPARVPETKEQRCTLTPATDIFELADELVVVVDLPGVDKSDVSVGVEQDVLTIRGAARTDLKGQALYREYELADYLRQFELGEQVDQEKIRAGMTHGVLTIRLPKVEKAKPKQVEVKVDS